MGGNFLRLLQGCDPVLNELQPPVLGSMSVLQTSVVEELKRYYISNYKTDLTGEIDDAWSTGEEENMDDAR